MALTFAISAMFILAGIGAAIDFSTASSKRNTFQSLADIAVLAAAQSGETNQNTLLNIARNVVDANNFSGEVLTVSLVLTASGQVEVSVSGAQETMLMSMFGQSQINVNVMAASPLTTSAPLHIALVLDVTGSMSGSKLSTLKTASTDLVDTLEDFDNGALKISVVPFAQYVNIGVSYSAEPWLDLPFNWQGCVGSRLTPGHEQVAYGVVQMPGLDSIICSSEIQPLTSNFNAVRSTISGLGASGWTYIPAGLIWGWRTLDTNAPLTEANIAFADNTENVLILMTDGANTRSKSLLTHDGVDTADANTVTANLCTNVKTDNIKIYSIAYDVTDPTTIALMSACATQPTMFYDAGNSAALKQAFEDIGASLLKLRLSH